jgi:hypothetical protein
MDHLPFGYDVVASLRPRTIVELGTQSGLSYFCLCQSVAEHGVEARCYAVDTWEGDAHTGRYDERTHQLVVRHNEEHYASFSTLLRMRFDEAAHRFEDDSIELLHIDGFHTYEAVRGDFKTWLPKVRAGGVVLFHDVFARLMDFGVWKFWLELEKTFDTCLFKHGFGLGVLRKPGGPPLTEPLLRMLFEGDAVTHHALRAFYVHAAEHQDVLRKKVARDKLLQQAQAS